MNAALIEIPRSLFSEIEQLVARRDKLKAKVLDVTCGEEPATIATYELEVELRFLALKKIAKLQTEVAHLEAFDDHSSN